MYKLRDYQQDAVNVAIDWLKKSKEPGLIEAYTAAGKSMIVAEIARIVTGMTGKKVLVLQPNKELLQQNAAKYRLTGEPCSLFSASAGSKSVRHNVVFGTALSVKNQLDSFCEKFCLIILDEADASLTPSILSIIASIRDKNPNLRILGLTSSPYKLGHGYIYQLDINDKPMPEDKAKAPFFGKQIVHISGRDLLDAGYVSPVVIGSINESYDTSALEVNSMGKFTSDSVDRAFIGHGRKTSRIIADVIEKSQDRLSVLVFAATQQHCDEVMASLPPDISACVTDKTSSKDRESIVQDFKLGAIKYLVNVNIFTRGFDHPELDVIALLRATESSALLHQIVGRGVRISPNKKDCLLLDYAGNIDNHHPDGDLFRPVIKTWKSKGESEPITAICPDCNTENEFTPRKNDEGFKIDEHGYFIDLTGERITTDHGAMPAHMGRRCHGQTLIKGEFHRCTYYWTSKECEECGEKEDISARYCKNGHELIDPNARLIIEFRAMKRDPTMMQVDKVLSWVKRSTIAKSGAECLVIDWKTEYRAFTTWFQPRSGNKFLIQQYESLVKATNGLEVMPNTVSYKKNKDTGFYSIYAYNQEHDSVDVV